MKKSFIFSLLVLFVFCVQTPVRADILITPTRVVFDDKQRFADVTLANVTDQVKSYEIEWQLYKMEEGTGVYHNVEIAPEYDLTKLLSFAPRRVSLPPKGTQKIKLRFSRPSDMPDGDYHVHLKFRSFKITDPSVLSSQDDAISAQVSINLSFTIPIVVRIGEPKVSASIGQISLDRDQNGRVTMQVPVERDLALSYALLGYMRAYFDDGNGEKLVGEISNANVFPEVSRRDFKVVLTQEITAGKLRIEIGDYDYASGVVHAERVFDLE